jgi:hypothetical protein
MQHYSETMTQMRGYWLALAVGRMGEGHRGFQLGVGSWAHMSKSLPFIINNCAHKNAPLQQS